MPPVEEITAFLRALEQTQFLSAPAMQAYQRKLLDHLVRHAASQTAFYADRLRPLFLPGGSIDWDRWDDIPILTRAEAQTHFADLRAQALPKAAGAVSEDTSSGSTGRPLRFLTNALQDLASACCSERFFNWHGLGPQALTVRIRAATHPDVRYPKGHTVIGWRAGHPASRAIDLSIATPVAQQVAWLERMRPRYLASYPSNLRELARHIARSGSDLRFDALMSFGEMVTDDMRAEVEAVFGQPVLDRYGSSEVGHIAGTCPHSLRHHVSSEVVLLELIGEDGRPVPAGTVGRVVVTPFYNLAMPFIRYELGDYAVASAEPCGCGRNLPVLERIMGRTRNIFRFADGSQVWPVLFSRDLQAFVPNRQFQVVQRDTRTIAFRFVPEAQGQTNDLAGLSAYMRARLHPDITVVLSPVAAIARSAGGKFEDYLSLLDQHPGEGQALPPEA